MSVIPVWIAIRPTTSTEHAHDPDAQPSESRALPSTRASPIVSARKRADNSLLSPGSSLSTSTVTPAVGPETQGAPWSPRNRNVTFVSAVLPRFFAVTVAVNSSPTMIRGVDVVHSTSRVHF